MIIMWNIWVSKMESHNKFGKVLAMLLFSWKSEGNSNWTIWKNVLETGLYKMKFMVNWVGRIFLVNTIDTRLHYVNYIRIMSS